MMRNENERITIVVIPVKAGIQMSVTVIKTGFPIKNPGNDG